MAFIQHHPDPARRLVTARGTAYGFRIGISPHLRGANPFVSHPPRANHTTQRVITQNAHARFDDGRADALTHPVNLPRHASLAQSFTVPKSNGKERVVLNYAPGVNPLIDLDVFPDLQWSRLDDILSTLSALGPGLWLASFDISSAFDHVAVHPDDRDLLWVRAGRDLIMRPTTAPFGLSSAPALWDVLAHALWWICTHYFDLVLEYWVDDFLVVGRSEAECRRSLELAKLVAAWLGLSLAAEKEEGPSQCLDFTGFSWEAAAETWRVSLREKHAEKVRTAVARLSAEGEASIKELRSLAGLLSFCANVLPGGRPFIARLFSLIARSDAAGRLTIRISTDVAGDLRWWVEAIDNRRALPIHHPLQPGVPSVIFEVDASKYGAGGVFGREWFAWTWSADDRSRHINLLEAETILMALATWGPRLAGTRHIINVRTDSAVSLFALRAGHTRSRELLAILKAIYWEQNKYGIFLSIDHIPGNDNIFADPLSRGDFRRFRAAASDFGIAFDTHGTPPIRPAWTRFL